MDEIVKKFYSNGKDFNTQFGVFMGLNETNPERRPVEMPHGHTVSNIPQNPTPTPNPNFIPNASPELNQILSNTSPFMNSQKIVDQLHFKSFGDLMYNIPARTKKVYEMQQENLVNEKRNTTKLHMLEEKIKQLELKSKRLEAINQNFLNQENDNKKIKIKKKNKDGEDNDEDEDDDEDEDEEKSDEDKMASQEAIKVLSEIKEEITKKLLEDQMKKNEELSQMTLNIQDIKYDLINKFDRLENKQKLQLESIGYVLQHSGSRRVEGLAKRVLGKDFYDIEKMHNKFITPTRSELSKAQREVIKRTTDKRKSRNEKVDSDTDQPVLGLQPGFQSPSSSKNRKSIKKGISTESKNSKQQDDSVKKSPLKKSPLKKSPTKGSILKKGIRGSTTGQDSIADNDNKKTKKDSIQSKDAGRGSVKRTTVDSVENRKKAKWVKKNDKILITNLLNSDFIK